MTLQAFKAYKGVIYWSSIAWYSSVYWYISILVHRYAGTSVYWYIVTLVSWYISVRVHEHKSVGMSVLHYSITSVFIGMLVHCNISTLVHVYIGTMFNAKHWKFSDFWMNFNEIQQKRLFVFESQLPNACWCFFFFFKVSTVYLVLSFLQKQIWRKDQ